MSKVKQNGTSLWKGRLGAKSSEVSLGSNTTSGVIRFGIRHRTGENTAFTAEMPISSLEDPSIWTCMKVDSHLRYDSPMPSLTEEFCSFISWWCWTNLGNSWICQNIWLPRPGWLWNGGYPPRCRIKGNLSFQWIKKFFMTHASLSGWEGVLENLSVQRAQSSEEWKLLIHILELQAIQLALLHWTLCLWGLPVGV